ncbi:MAG TPA: hypothetical protein HA263_06670 [Methanoregulaceae archaeon]|nr:hypothetical protein [Methanoregulaceae archaeon]
MTDQPRPKGGRNQSVKRKNPPKPAEEPGTALWKKVLFISVGVLFVVLMIVSSMGTSWLNVFQTVKPGAVVMTDVTIRDDQNRPVLTTSETIYSSATKENRTIFLASPFTIDAGLAYTDPVMTVPIIAPQSGMNYTLFGEEYNAIVTGVVGMHPGGTKTVPLDTNVTEERNYTAEEFDQLGGDFGNTSIGDEMVLSFVENPEAFYDNTTTPTYALRTTHVVNRTEESVTLSFSLATADLTLSKVQSS